MRSGWALQTQQEPLTEAHQPVKLVSIRTFLASAGPPTDGSPRPVQNADSVVAETDDPISAGLAGQLVSQPRFGPVR